MKRSVVTALVLAHAAIAAAQQPGATPAGAAAAAVQTIAGADRRWPPHMPSPKGPHEWTNMKGLKLVCTASPWKQVDGCSIPKVEPVTAVYRKVFRDACDEHDVCYRTTGNTQAFCDGQFFNGLKRICDHRFPARADLPVNLPREQCFAAANSWGRSIGTVPQARTAYGEDQVWAGKTCKLVAAK